LPEDLDKAYRSDEAAAEYFARHRKNPIRRMVSRREQRIVTELLAPLPEGADLLDAACGAGRISAALAEAGWNPLGMDASAVMILKGIEAKHITPGGAALGSISMLPFRDRTFDGGVCIRFMHHLAGKEQRLTALEELRRVVQGPIVVSFWTRFNVQHMRRCIKRLFGRRPSARHALRLKQYKNEVKSAGLSVKRVRFLYPFVSETVYLLIHPEEAGPGDRV
jgi:SAM-dependent methyltransferase